MHSESQNMSEFSFRKKIFQNLKTTMQAFFFFKIDKIDF